MTEFGHEVWDGDNEFNAKIDVTDPEEFKKLLHRLKAISREDVLEIFSTYCHSFESNDLEIPAGFEDHIYSFVKNILNRQA